MAHILLGRVIDVGEGVGAVEAPHEDEAIVGHEVAPDDDEVDVERVVDVDTEVEADIFVEDTGVDGAITSWPAAAEIIEARLPPSAYAGQLWRLGQVSYLASMSSRRPRCCRSARRTCCGSTLEALAWQWPATKVAEPWV